MADRSRYTAFGLTWLSYATYYTGRKGFSVAKKTLAERYGISELTLGAIDTLYLTAYAGGQFLNGLLGDRIGARRLVGYGMLASAACCGIFGLGSAAWVFGIAFALNGLAQSTGWPGNTRAMAEWTTPATRGTVMSLWATCYQVGGIVATVLAGWLLVRSGWRSTFFGPAALMALVGVLVLLWLRPGPGAEPPAETDTVVDLQRGAVHRELRRESTAVLRRRAQARLLRSPTLWFYGASYFFIKFIRYALLFWLPYFLAQRLDYDADVAAYVSSAFEVGGIAGVIVIGIASDRLRRFSRSAMAAVWLVGLSASLLVYALAGFEGIWGNAVVLAMIGAMLFGPDSLLSGAAAQDAGGPHAAATATGFVNGLGSLGAILEGLTVPLISARYGWQAVFPVFVVLALLAAGCLLPTLRRGPAPRGI